MKILYFAWLREKTVKGILHLNGENKAAIPTGSHG